MLSNWLEKVVPLCHPVRCKTKTNRDSLAIVFPHSASTTFIIFEFLLVHCIVFVLCDWPECLGFGFTTLNWPFRNSAGNWGEFQIEHSLVPVYPKSIILGQMTNLNMIFQVVVSVYRLIKIWKSGPSSLLNLGTTNCFVHIEAKKVNKHTSMNFVEFLKPLPSINYGFMYLTFRPQLKL